MLTETKKPLLQFPRGRERERERERERGEERRGEERERERERESVDTLLIVTRLWLPHDR